MPRLATLALVLWKIIGSALARESLCIAGPSLNFALLFATHQPEDGSDGYVIPIPAHKVVLVRRSPVFKAMLENEREETRNGTIKIGDVSYIALRSFVNYTYTAEAYLEDQMAFDLLVLAEKYQVKHLKAYFSWIL